MTEPILFYDGTCGLCHKFVALLLQIDRKHVFRLAPLQGVTAGQLLPSSFQNDLSTVVVWDNGVLKLKSAAIIHVFQCVGGLWRLIAFIMRLSPGFLRDFTYDLIATNRYRLFGKFESCRVPTTQERQRLLP